MSDKPTTKNSHSGRPADPSVELAADIAEASAEAANETAPDGSPEAVAQALADALAKSQAEVAELKDKVLRTLAEMENVRRRADKEAADARAYGVTKFAGDMVGVADNLRRALEAVPQDALGEGPLKALVEGVELTERDLTNKLERHGVKPIDPLGQKFDPNLHQAMFEAQNPELPNGHVMQVVQVGYTIGDRVLRPALVGVARGGPKAGASTPDTPPPGSTESRTA